MKTNYRKLVHKDFRGICVRLPFNKVMFALAAAALPLAFRLTKTPKEISHEKIIIKGYNGLPLPIHIFKPQNGGENLPCLLYLHGGGFAYKAAPYHKKLVCAYAKRANCVVVFPDYRLLPKYPFPAAQQDALAAYSYIVSSNLPIDKSRIAVGGDSAGGGLAACFCNMVGDFPPPCFQMLIYPVTDMSEKTESMRRFSDTPLWNCVNNDKMRKMYLGKDFSNKLASPMLNELPPKLPPAYIETAQYDCLCDEGVNYAKLLERHGGKVFLNQTQGTIHGYDSLLKSAVTQENLTKRIEVLRLAFGQAETTNHFE